MTKPVPTNLFGEPDHVFAPGCEPQPTCPACGDQHRPFAPCYASRVDPALYAEAAMRHHFDHTYAGLPATEIARKVGVSSAFISQIRTGRKRLSKSLLADLGFERVTFYRRKP